jgi:hypothetical protein
MSLRDAPSCPGWPPCLRADRLRTGRLGADGGSFDGGMLLFCEFWPAARSSFSKRSPMLADLVEQPQHQLAAARQRNPLGILTTQFHAP